MKDKDIKACALALDIHSLKQVEEMKAEINKGVSEMDDGDVYKRILSSVERMVAQINAQKERIKELEREVEKKDDLLREKEK